MWKQSSLFKTIATISLVLSACNKAPDSDESSDTDESDGFLIACEGATARGTPASNVGQIVLAVDGEIDPCSVQGHLVGEGTTPGLAFAYADDGTAYVDNVPEGEHDIVVTGALAIAGAELLGEPTHGIRLSDVVVAAGGAKDLGKLALPKMGQASGKATLIGGEGIKDFAGVRVYVPGTQYDATSAADGTFAFDRLPVGVHNFFYEKSGYFRGVVEGVDVKSSATAEIPQVDLLLETDGVGGIVIAGGKASSNSLSVSLTVIPTEGAVVMKISEDQNFSDKGFIPLQTSSSFIFSTGGSKTLYVQFANENGQNSSTFSDKIEIDVTGPTGTIALQNGADYTASRDIKINTALEDASEIAAVMISETNDFTGSKWVDYAEVLLFKLSASEGAKTVYLKAKDIYNQESVTISDTINLDLTKPTFSNLYPSNGETNVGFSGEFVVQATPSEALNQDNIDIEITDPDGNSIPFVLELDDNTLELETSSTGFLPNTVYTITITTEVADVAGNTMSSFTWSFTSEPGWLERKSSQAIATGGQTSKGLISLSDINGNGLQVFGTRLSGDGVFARHFRDGKFGDEIDLSEGTWSGDDVAAAMGSDGHAIAVWVDDDKIRGRIYDADTKTWGNRFVVNPNIDAANTRQNLLVAAGPNKEFAVLFLKDDTEYPTVYVHSGGAWNAGASVITGSFADLNLAMSGSDNVFVAYTASDQVYVRRYNGTAWDGSATRLDGNPENFVSANETLLAVDASGNAVVSFILEIDAVEGNSCEVEACTIMVSFWNGSTWSAASDISNPDAAGANSNPFKNSELFMFGENQVLATWSDFQSARGHKYMNYFNGTIWGTKREITSLDDNQPQFSYNTDLDEIVMVWNSFDEPEFNFSSWDPTASFSSAFDSSYGLSQGEGSGDFSVSPLGQRTFLSWHYNNESIYMTFMSGKEEE